MPEPITVTITGRNGPKTYVLRAKLVMLRGGRSAVGHYFEPADPAYQLPTAFQVCEMPRAELPEEWLLRMARAMVDVQGLSADDAAAAVVSLKRMTCGLGERQAAELQKRINRQLGG